jgi:hypothetical protein
VLKFVGAEPVSLLVAEAAAAVHPAPEAGEVPRPAVPPGRVGTELAPGGCSSQGAAQCQAAIHRVVAAASAQESALEHPGAIHVDVAAQPLPTANVRVLLTRGDIELLARAWSRGHQALLRPIGIVTVSTVTVDKKSYKAAPSTLM